MCMSCVCGSACVGVRVKDVLGKVDFPYTQRPFHLKLISLRYLARAHLRPAAICHVTFSFGQKLQMFLLFGACFSALCCMHARRRCQVVFTFFRFRGVFTFQMKARGRSVSFCIYFKTILSASISLTFINKFKWNFYVRFNGFAFP